MRRSLSHRLRVLTKLGSGSGRKQKAEKKPIRQIWRCVNGSPAENGDAPGRGLGNAARDMAPPPHRLAA
jgi:hypothetical protein